MAYKTLTASPRPPYSTRRHLLLSIRLLIGVASLYCSQAFATIAYVQGTSQNPDFGSSVSVTLDGAEGAGHLNVVIVGWNDSTSSIQSVTDSNGNTYVAAVGPVTNAGNASQIVYYAKNVAAGNDTVTVAFSGTVNYPNVRVLEYSGIDTVNAFDTGVSGSGSGLTQNSGSLTTTNANDLLVASNYVADVTTASDPNYTQRFITAGGELVEDRIVSSTGSYSASSTQGNSGFWVMQLAAFRAASSGGSGDTQVPTAPASLAVASVSTTSVYLSWSASTDNVGVTGYNIEGCQGTSCTTFTQLGTSSTTAYSASALTASTDYSFRVRATDAAGNLSAYSNVATTTTSDPDPTAPSGLLATAVSEGEIDLSWTAATQNTNLDGYPIERCGGIGCSDFAPIAEPSATTFADTGLLAGTSYSYRVRALTNDGEFSTYTNVSTAVTQGSAAPPDTDPPTAPGDMNASTASGSVISLSWSPATDNVGVTAYILEDCSGAGCTNFAPVGTLNATNYVLTALPSASTYRFRVRATDAAGNVGAYSAIASATTAASGLAICD